MIYEYHLFKLLILYFDLWISLFRFMDITYSKYGYHLIIPFMAVIYSNYGYP